jgi:hypothetical protein
LFQHVHHVASSGHNYLFRGGRPTFDNETMNYDGLVSIINSAAQNVSIQLPAFYYLIDLNLLNLKNDDDIAHTFTEYEFWKQNQKLGKYLFWET